MVDEDEVALIRRAQRGDHRAFGRLALTHERVLFNLALRMVRNREDARDLTQAVFLKAYRSLPDFDVRHRFYSWLYRIMLNECLNHLSRKKLQVPLNDQIAAAQNLPDDDCSDTEVSRIIQVALMELNLDYRKVIVLRHFLHLSYQEISDVLNIPDKKVKSRLFTARQLLGDILKRRGVATA